MSYPLINPTPTFLDSAGAPLDSGTIEFRNPASNALIDSFPTADDADAQTNANANPLTLNARGEAANGLYLEDDVKYKIILKDSGGSTVWTQDDVRCPGRIDGLVYNSGKTGGEDRTQKNKNQDLPHLFDFLTATQQTDVTDRTENNTYATELQQFIDAYEPDRQGVMYLPSGTILVDSTITIDDEAVNIQGAGAIVEQMFTTSVAPKGTVIKLADAAFNSSSMPILKIVYQGGNSEARIGVTIRDLVIFGNRSTDTLSPINTGTYNNNNTYGIGVQMVGTRYVTLENVFSLWCAEDGFQAVTGGSESVQCNNLYLNRCVGISNGDDGFDLAAGDSHAVALQAGHNGGDGIAASGGMIYTGCNVWDNFANGYRVSASHMNITGGETKDNQAAGILVSGALERVTITGIDANDNGKDTSLTDQERSGIYISGASSGVVSNCTLSNRNDSSTQVQQYGLRIVTTNARWRYSNIGDGIRPSTSTGGRNAIALISDLSKGGGDTETLIKATGNHDGAGDAAVLTDSGESWEVNQWIGYTLSNTTDGSSTTVTSNTATTATGVLAGGTDDDWDASDAYTLVPPAASTDFGVSLLDSSGGALTITLGAGNHRGQIKTFEMTDASSSSTLDITNHATSDPERFTFAALKDSLVVLWTGSEWVTLSLVGATV